MDSKTIHGLSLVINDYINRFLDYNSARKKINGLLHNKLTKNVFKSLSDLIEKLSGNKKNKVTLIVVMALLLRNYEDFTLIQTIIQKNECKNYLYGGLITLLSGKSDAFSLECELQHDFFKNKYEFVLKFPGSDYGNCTFVLKSAQLLHNIDRDKFEKLVLKDSSKLLLLNMTSFNLEATPSDKLIKKLLVSSDDLQRSIGLYFISTKLTRAVDEIRYYNRCLEIGSHITKDRNKLQKELEFECKKFMSHINKCEKPIQADLLFNYYMVNLFAYPKIILEKLMSSELQIEFAWQIKNSGKVKNLKEICCITQEINKCYAYNQNNRRVSKINLFMAITELLISFFEKRKFYIWNKQEAEFMKTICGCLPIQCASKLKKYLSRTKQNLLCSEIDRLVRFKIYLKDEKQCEIIDHTLRFL